MYICIFYPDSGYPVSYTHLSAGVVKHIGKHRAFTETVHDAHGAHGHALQKIGGVLQGRHAASGRIAVHNAASRHGSHIERRGRIAAAQFSGCLLYTSTAYELDLVKGVSDSRFNPSGNMTIAATVALACRLHSIYHTGTAEFVQGSPWYQVYVDYAVKNGIIRQNQFTNYNANATRRQFAAILAHALPETALEQKNTVDDGMIPDVAAGSASCDAVSYTHLPERP